MELFYKPFVALLPGLGALLILFLLSHMLRSNKHPGSTIAWVLAIIFIPYVAVPAYLILGGRKLRHRAQRKKAFELHNHEMFSPADVVNEGFFSQKNGNKVTPLLNGEDAYAEIMKLINEAEESILVSMYILGRDKVGREFIKVLAQKAASGVKVYLLLDGIGCMWITTYFLAKLKKAGGKTTHFLPMIRLPVRGRASLRNHRKIIVIDQAVAFVGGMNIADEYMGLFRKRTRWKDLAFLIEGNAVADFLTIFMADWEFAMDQKIELDPVTKRKASEGLDLREGTSVKVLPSGPDVAEDFLYEAMLDRIFKAKRSIDIATPYYVPDETLQRALCIAARKGIAVRLLMPRRSDNLVVDWVRRSYLRELRQAGVQILFYLPAMLHAKLMVIDKTLTISGSANMDIRSLLLNYEVAFIMNSPEHGEILTGWFEELAADSIEPELPEHILTNTFEGMGRVLAPIL